MTDVNSQATIASLNEIESLTYHTQTMKLQIPAARFGVIEIKGSSALPVIDLDGNVYEPLHDKEVNITLQLTKDGNQHEMKQFQVCVTGTYDNGGENTKPKVIPELAEWYGLDGVMPINAATKVVVKDDQWLEAALMLIADLKDIGIHLSMGDASERRDSDVIIFDADHEHGLQKEGYSISIANNKVVIYAAHHIGAFYATRSLHQMLKNSADHCLPNGYARDYPKYPIRGFMLDVGRKFTKLDQIYDMIKTLSYYKMNDFQIHLNDNAIFLEHFSDAKEALEKAYTGFRLESDLEGHGHTLTAQDGFYTKAAFRQLITDAQKLGITIVPEFDTPGHAMSFVKIRPELMYQGSIVNGKIDQERAAMLNLEHPETLPFIKSMYNEFLDGDDPVIGNVPVHIGSDEYYGDAEVYRAYVNDLLAFIRDDKKRTARVWGSLSIKTGTTPVTSKGIQMDVWNTNWADPKEMLDQGFDIINIEDHQVYMVPGADYYQDYLDTEVLFRTYQPNTFNNGCVIPESHPQLLGGAFALWNDQIDKLENGITCYDMFDRIFDALPIIAQRNWGTDSTMTYEAFRALSKSLAYAPNTNPRFQVPSKTATIVHYDFHKGLNDLSGNEYDVIQAHQATQKNGMMFNGEDAFLETPLTAIGPDAQLDIELELTDVYDKQVLLEADDGGIIYAVNADGYIGYEFEANTYSFDYKLKPNQKVLLSFVTTLHQTKLFVNDQEVRLTDDTMKPFNTLILPLQRIGSSQDSLHGTISMLKLTVK
ncbi:family 20 glycosylhydrolase [Lentibacillus saliphilus]|uniref:family 20 glycosylhydrolase n=1 Tax=Lentibacillus saliphilus TaxID=2737028 RepID=UPI001C30ED6D|nr:family 20 glycosylhydrolase [Lentibacillus saliphilus]